MKKTIKITNLLLLTLLLITYSCDKDDDPVIINLQNLEVTIDENPIVGQVIGTVQSDSASSLTYSITTESPTGAISIDANSGELTVVDASLFDFETNPIITATISAVEAENIATVTININNVNELNTQDFTATVDENPTNGDSLSTIQATGDGTLSFSITSQSPTGALNIDATTGELTVADATLFDFETNPVITANISVDNTVNTATVIATINLNNINELSIQDFDATIDENPTNGQSVGTVSAAGDGTLSFSITSQTPSGALNIDANTGELTVADATLFDFETNPVIAVNISVDNSVSTETAVATIDLNDLHEIGEFKFGGVIFWVNAANDEGYVVSISDQSTGAEWGCSGLDVPNAYSLVFGDGEANTLAIVIMCPVPGTAADIANDAYNGYNDWFLPNQGEWLEIYANKAVVNTAAVANGGSIITNEKYWSSTTYHSVGAYSFRFWDGLGETDNKSTINKVRAIRAFTDF